MKAIVTAGTYVDRSLPTASWWDEYELIAGEYPVRWTTVTHHEVTQDHPQAYYAVITVPAILTKTYRVNRVFTASSSETREPHLETTVTFTNYVYNAKPGVHLVNGLVTLT